MRRLMYFTMGFGAVTGACVYADGKLFRYLAAVMLVILLCRIEKNVPFKKKGFLALMGGIMGLCLFSQFQSRYLSPILPLDAQTVSLAIRASDYEESRDYGVFFDGTVELEGHTYQIQTRLKESQNIQPGMTVTGDFVLQVVKTGFGSGKDLFLSAAQRGDVTIRRDESRWQDNVAKIRKEIKTILKTVFPPDAYPFAKALLLGDTSDLSYAVDTDLKISGVRHVVAVSGLHISIVFGLLSMVTLRKRLLTVLVGYPLLFFFGALTGFTPSVVRACLMWGLVLLARLVDREYDGPTSLSFAVLVMLILNPLVIASVGFQLSVASVAGIFLFSDGIMLWLRSFCGEIRGRNLWAWLIRGSTASAAVTLGATVLTTPLCAYYFGMVSLVGLVTNLLCLWVVSIVFYGIMAVCLLYGLVPVLGSVLAWLIAWPIRYVLWVAEIMADFPLAAVYTVSPYITAWLVFVYGMLALFLKSGNRKPYIFGCCAVIGLCLALTADWTESMGDDVRITVLDVGQGQSILLQSEGRSFLVDCGGDSGVVAADRAAEALRHQGIRKLDGLILTHLDEDHANGASGLLNRVETELLILPEVYSDLPLYTDAAMMCVTQHTEIAFGETTISLYPADFPGNSNEKSVCVLFDTKKCDILVTGDRDGYGERSLLRNADIPDVDVLVAGHHGAASSTCEELLAAVKPELVCISVGAGNFYGHPAPALLQRLAALGCQVYRTDVQGTITIRR